MPTAFEDKEKGMAGGQRVKGKTMGNEEGTRNQTVCLYRWLKWVVFWSV